MRLIDASKREESDSGVVSKKFVQELRYLRIAK
jgi:hypothetical protein